MKQKTFYIIVIVCCLSLFSSAKQAGKEECMKHICSESKKQKITGENQATKETQKTYDLSPLQLFMFSI